MTKIVTIFKVFGAAIIVLFVFWLIYSFVQEMRDNRQLEAAVVKWESKYDLVLMTQQAAEEQIAKLLEESESLQQQLLVWQQNYKAIETKNKQAQSRIKQLEIDNETVRGILNTPIPDELWRGIFPDTKRYDSINNSSQTAQP